MRRLPIQKARHFPAGLLLRTNETYVNSPVDGTARRRRNASLDGPMIDRGDIEKMYQYIYRISVYLNKYKILPFTWDNPILI